MQGFRKVAKSTWKYNVLNIVCTKSNDWMDGWIVVCDTFYRNTLNSVNYSQVFMFHFHGSYFKEIPIQQCHVWSSKAECVVDLSRSRQGVFSTQSSPRRPSLWSLKPVLWKVSKIKPTSTADIGESSPRSVNQSSKGHLVSPALAPDMVWSFTWSQSPPPPPPHPTFTP